MIRKIISYIFPVTRKIKSEYSGYLELTLLNGRKLLDTAHANYSYGSLQRVLAFSLKQVQLSGVETVLLMGLGGGSVVKTLREVFNYEGYIVAVDVDPVVIRIAGEEFGVVSDSRTTIKCIDAFDFIRKGEDKFDLVIIDLFIDNKIPRKFLAMDFWNAVKVKIRDNGYIIFNTISETTDNIEEIKDELKKYGFKLKEYKNIEKTNDLLIANYC